MERVIHAEHSSDLGERVDGEVGDVDVLRAVGMASQDGNLAVALALWRLISYRDGHQLPIIVRGLQGFAVRLNLENPEGAICRVLNWVMDPACHACHGRGETVIEGAPNFLSGEPCPACGGSGRSDPGFSDGEKAMRDWLLNLQGFATSAINRKLHG